MKVLSLGLSGASDEIRLRLQQDCRLLVKEGFRIAVDETNKGSYTFLACNIAEGELSFRNYERLKNMLKTCVARMLADMIVTREEGAVVRKIINSSYHYFGEQERAAIFDRAVKLLDPPGGLGVDFSRADRHRRIMEKLTAYLDNHHELVVEGFIAFRLKEYRQSLSEVVDKAVDAYMMDLEYKEFIRVLRYFVDVQETQVDEVHVIVGGGDDYKIRDSAGNAIHNHYLDSFMLRGAEDINYEDLLISALITIAPRNVMLHVGPAARGHDMVTTIQNVFEDRVIVCDGCEACRNEFRQETENN